MHTPNTKARERTSKIGDMPIKRRKKLQLQAKDNRGRQVNSLGFHDQEDLDCHLFSVRWQEQGSLKVSGWGGSYGRR